MLPNFCVRTVDSFNLNPVFLVVSPALLFLLLLPGIWNFISAFYFQLSFSNNLRESRCKKEGEACRVVLAHWEQGFNFHSFWPWFIIFYFVLGALFFISIQQFFKKFIQIQCVCGFWVGCGNWFTSQPLFSFLAISRLSGLSVLGLSFPGRE